MSVKITGVDEILKNIEVKLGESRTNRVVNKALRDSGEKGKEIVEQAMSTFEDTGETHDTVILSKIKTKPGKHIAIGWGDGSRWRLVHLNEFGFTRKGKRKYPRGLGKLQGAIDKTQTEVIPIVIKDLEELAK